MANQLLVDASGDLAGVDARCLYEPGDDPVLLLEQRGQDVLDRRLGVMLAQRPLVPVVERLLHALRHALGVHHTPPACNPVVVVAAVPLRNRNAAAISKTPNTMA